MSVTIQTGDFLHFGARRVEGGLSLTFQAKTEEMPAILIYDISTLQLIKRFELSKEYARGNVYSVILSGLEWEMCCYLLEINGELVPDPFARGIVGREVWADDSRWKSNYQVFCRFPEKPYQFQNKAPALLDTDLVIYKMHMRGITMDTGLSEDIRGKSAGFLRKLKNLKELGITAIEFQPLYEFEELRFQAISSVDTRGRIHKQYKEAYGLNYWGYGAANYFAPKASYFGEKPEYNMKQMIDKMHGLGMEIYLEMNFVPEVDDDLIISCLRFWAMEYEVDGFHLIGMTIPMERIARDPYLSNCRIFHDHIPVELLCKEESSPRKHLYIYNDDFIYPLRKLQNHMDGSLVEFSNMLRRQNASYGFVNYAAYNTGGFTLLDAYSYSEKHNEVNGEDNRDGNNYNCSHNYGIEGETANKQINSHRLKNVRTALLSCILGQGIPLICAGDECGNSQKGNNNPYGQDNELAWVNYPRKASYKRLYQYTKDLLSFRRGHTVLRSSKPIELSDYRHTGAPDVSYHGREPWIMWLSDDMKSFGIYYNGAYGLNGREDDVMLCFNFYLEEDTLSLPRLPRGRAWYLVTNTVDESFEVEEKLLTETITLPGGSASILIGHKKER